MNRSPSAEKTYFYALVLWGLIYLTLAFVSLKLDDPQSRVAMVWFPAGAAVSACLFMPRRFWPALYIMLFTLRTGLDTLMRHSLETSLIISLISLSGDFLVALSVQYFGRQRDDFCRVSAWLISTLIISALAAAAGAGWLASRHAEPFTSTAALWWAANVSGNIVATTVLTGITWESARRATRDVVKSFTGIMLVAIAAALIFRLPAGQAASAGLIYGLACLPILLTIAVPIMAGVQAGALAFLALSAVAIFFSWQQAGPFFIEGLRRGEPLLLAQGYLSGTAVLTIFVRLLLRLPEARVGMRHMGDDDGETAFRLDARTGRLVWDPHASPVLARTVAQLADRDSLLRSLETGVSEMLVSRWEQATAGIPVKEAIVFRLLLPDGESVTVRERGLFFLPDTSGGYLVGYWTPVTGISPLTRTEDR
ncbi:MASE1 domain-containing protein [Erwinia sp. HDF1-3R]|uniref:MASE1 domain-containing protein n=1 Tax=Erwinia sp. HDF1-3R TaxID=3141543 RepID=UPI0031F5C047